MTYPDKKIKGIIFDIQRYSLHDGNGIRTLVFMKGCPLKCLWCSNPESQNFDIEIGSISKDCIGCGKCHEICKQYAIQLPDYSINKALCNNCKECAKVCFVKAKRTIGKEITVDQLLETVERDRLFYKNSGGGITVGGGEPSAQSEFVSEFLKSCKEINLNTCIETCGYASWDKFFKTAEYADIIYFDLKQFNSNKHKALTGVDNELILDNARKIGVLKDIIIRIPVVPGLNDDYKNLSDTIKFASELPRIQKVELLPYHTLGLKKYELIGAEYCLNELKSYSKEQLADLNEKINQIEKNVEVNII